MEFKVFFEEVLIAQSRRVTQSYLGPGRHLEDVLATEELLKKMPDVLGLLNNMRDHGVLLSSQIPDSHRSAVRELVAEELCIPHIFSDYALLSPTRYGLSLLARSP